jgi:CRP/FNR family transcriptional activator FtrB
LSRAFGTLKAYGVEVDGANVTLSNIKDLTTLAKPTALIDDPTI